MQWYYVYYVYPDYVYLVNLSVTQITHGIINDQAMAGIHYSVKFRGLGGVAYRVLACNL